MSLCSACVLILLVILAEALGVSVVVLMFILLSQMGGLSLNIEEAGAFNLHPFLMTFGLVFLYGNGKFTSYFQNIFYFKRVHIFLSSKEYNI